MGNSPEVKRTYIIAEAGVNHNGSLERALKLCDIAKKAGADAIKFQTWVTDKIVLKGAPQAKYQEQNTKSDRDQYSLLKELELSKKEFMKIKEYCDKINLEFLSTPDDQESLHFLISQLGLKKIKVGSGEVTNLPFLKEVSTFSEEIILSTGMSNIADIEKAIEIMDYPDKTKLSLLHCTSSYPCPYQSVNLNAIHTMRKHFKYNIGYSDHTLGISISLAAVAIGAHIIEKHFTQDKDLSGPDHKCSLEPNELKEMINQIRLLEQSLGSYEKDIQNIEIDSRKTVTKTITSMKDITKGTIFDENNISLLRTGKNGINGQNWYSLIGKRSKYNYKKFDNILNDEINN